MTKFRCESFAAHARVALALVSILGLAACVSAPHSRSAAQSANPVTLNGYVPSQGETITLSAYDQNTGALVPVGSTMSTGPGMPFTTPGGFHYTAYPWTWAYPGGGVIPAHFWSPQMIVPDLATAQGHLEIVATDGGAPFHTFSEAAFNDATAHAPDPLSGATQYSDGTSTVLFDPYGVGSMPALSFVNVQGATLQAPGGYGKVAFSVGYYTVEGGKKIYALICSPVSGGPYPAVVFNHGGFDKSNGGNISGAITASAWTTQPMGAPDGLGQCLDWAKRGWIFATSAYRGESVNIASASPAFASGSWPSDGNVEFCLGEVTDVLALSDLVAHHASAISIGAASQPVSLNANGKLLMLGYSHGGCITWRAVEQGAPVSAVVVAEGFTDIRLNYLLGLNHALTVLGWPLPVAAYAAALGSGAWQPPIDGPNDMPISPPPPAYQPDANGVMGYNWRSAHYFASHGDLAIEKFRSLPVLILHGDVDIEPPAPADPAPLNPTPLAQATEISADLAATNIFVGPASPPVSEPCIDGPEGAPIPPGVTAPNKSCPVSFTPMNASDPCFSPPFPYCKPIHLPLASQPQQRHYLVVFHGMDHVNGWHAIKNTLNGFAEGIFTRQPGCSGLEPDCATD